MELPVQLTELDKQGEHHWTSRGSSHPPCQMLFVFNLPSSEPNFYPSGFYSCTLQLFGVFLTFCAGDSLLLYEVPTASTGHSHDAIWRRRKIYTPWGIDIGAGACAFPLWSLLRQIVLARAYRFYYGLSCVLSCVGSLNFSTCDVNLFGNRIWEYLIIWVGP